MGEPRARGPHSLRIFFRYDRKLLGESRRLCLASPEAHHEGNPYVIPGKKPGAHLVGMPKIWQRIRKRAGLEDVRLHDLRHSFASVGAGASLSLPIIGKLLGHTQAATTQRYAHLALKAGGSISTREEPEATQLEKRV